MDLYNEPSIQNVAKIIRESTRGVLELNKLSPVKKGLFCYDLAFVVLGVRTGYLVDVILPNDPVAVFSRLLRILRAKSPRFHNIIHILDPICDQSFFVNTVLIHQRLCRLAEVQFIHLSSDSCTLLQCAPADVQETLELLNSYIDLESVPASLLLSLRDSSVAVPVAAVLIEYPVAFVPEPTFTSFLRNVPLDVYECIVNFDSHTHILLKFSCPTDLGVKYPDLLSSDRLVLYLKSWFGSEERIGRWKDTELQVTHHIETRDRVVL